MQGSQLSSKPNSNNQLLTLYILIMKECAMNTKRYLHIYGSNEKKENENENLNLNFIYVCMWEKRMK